MRFPLAVLAVGMLTPLLAACDTARDDERVRLGWVATGPYGGDVTAVAHGPDGRLYTIARGDVYERAPGERWARIQEGAAAAPLLVTRRGAVYTGRSPAGLRPRAPGARAWT